MKSCGGESAPPLLTPHYENPRRGISASSPSFLVGRRPLSLVESSAPPSGISCQELQLSGWRISQSAPSPTPPKQFSINKIKLKRLIYSSSLPAGLSLPLSVNSTTSNGFRIFFFRVQSYKQNVLYAFYEI